MARNERNKNLTPEERLKCIISYTKNVEIDPSVNAKLYYKSGLNMVQQFNIYYRERNWENALAIYLKYELLFFDKIRKHPEYDRISVNVKSVNASNFRLIKPKAEHTKRELFKQYKREYLSYCDELKRNEIKEVCGFRKKLRGPSKVIECEEGTKDLNPSATSSSSDTLISNKSENGIVEAKTSKSQISKANFSKSSSRKFSENIPNNLKTIEDLNEQPKEGEERSSYLSAGSAKVSGKKKEVTMFREDKRRSSESFNVSFVVPESFKESVELEKLRHSNLL